MSASQRKRKKSRERAAAGREVVTGMHNAGYIVGRPKAGPERDLAARHVERAAAGRAIGFFGVDLREAEESRAARPYDRKREEAKAIRGLLAPPANVIALDENGTQMTSRSLATELGRARD